MIWLVPCDFSSTFRKKAGPRPPLSPGHAVDLLVDVIPMLLAFKGNWFQSLFLSSWGKWKKLGFLGALFPLIAEICWNDIGNVLPFGYFEFIHCFSGINMDKSETRKKQYLQICLGKCMATFGDLTPNYSWGMEGVQRLGETGAKNARKKPYFKGKSCHTFYKKTAVGRRNTTNIQLITFFFLVWTYEILLYGLEVIL